MRLIPVFFVFLLSVFPVWCHGKSIDRSQLVAEIMGDIMFAYDSFDREKIGSIERKLNKLEEVVSVYGTSDKRETWKMIEAFSRALLHLDNSMSISNDDMKLLVDEYDMFFERTVKYGKNDPVFRILDLRFRYLSKTSAGTKDMMIVPSIKYSIEDVYPDADRIVMEVAKGSGRKLKQKWMFLGRLITDYQNNPAPYIVNSMAMKICLSPEFI
ncbi:MAG: hypothetical protein Q7T32_12855 [Moraxellaceae bacterium]|nr:hypothetical protein [Moraxellaceae bacterium]